MTHTRRAVAAVFVLIFLAITSAEAAAGVEGRYIKDDRGLDELGLIVTLEVEPADGGQYHFRWTAANPALCGGVVEGRAALSGNAAVVREENCAFRAAFSGDRVEVSPADGEDCYAPHCKLTGTYYRYGALALPLGETIQRIREHYAHINAHISDYDREERGPGELEGGGRLQAWVYMGWVKKIAVDRQDGDQGIHEEYYFWDNDLFFCFRSARPTGQADAPAAEDRYYFHQGRLIRYIGPDGNRLDAGGTDFDSRGAGVLSRARRYLEMIRP